MQNDVDNKEQGFETRHRKYVDKFLLSVLGLTIVGK